MRIDGYSHRISGMRTSRDGIPISLLCMSRNVTLSTRCSLLTSYLNPNPKPHDPKPHYMSCYMVRGSGFRSSSGLYPPFDILYILRPISLYILGSISSTSSVLNILGSISSISSALNILGFMSSISSGPRHDILIAHTRPSLSSREVAHEHASTITSTTPPHPCDLYLNASCPHTHLHHNTSCPNASLTPCSTRAETRSCASLFIAARAPPASEEVSFFRCRSFMPLKIATILAPAANLPYL